MIRQDLKESVILIVEDEFNLGETLVEYLNSIGFESYWAKTGEEAKVLFKDKRPSIVLMDIGLPDTDGLTLAKFFRNTRKDFALLFVSALNDPEIKVEGLEIGADDYITKPFALKELLLRLKKIESTQSELSHYPDEIQQGPLKIWFKKYEVQDAQGTIIPLSQKECAILELLYVRSGQVIPRDEIIDIVWGEDKYPSNRTVDNYIVKLRKWCETDIEKNIQIISIRGIGYKLIKKN